jgi:hypothetical protein
VHLFVTQLLNRALALKKKTEAQREEQRRQAILAKRKEQIREATEKYQRLNKHYDAREYTDPCKFSNFKFSIIDVFVCQQPLNLNPLAPI